MDSSYRDFKQWSWPSLQPNPDGVAWPTAPCVTQQVYIVLETWVTMTGVIENFPVPSGSMKIPSHQQLLRYVPVNSRFQVFISLTIPLARTFSLLQRGSLHETVGKRPRGARKGKWWHHSKTEANIYPFFSRSHCLICHPARCFFLYHVTVSCKDPLSWSNYHSWAKNIAQIPHLILAVITDDMPLPLVKKTVEKFNCIPRQTGNFKVAFNLSLEFLHIFSPFFSSFIRRTLLSLQHQISIFTIICTEDSIISTKSVAMGLTMQNCRPQEWLCLSFFYETSSRWVREFLYQDYMSCDLGYFGFWLKNTNSKKKSTLIGSI